MSYEVRLPRKTRRTLARERKSIVEIKSVFKDIKKVKAPIFFARSKKDREKESRECERQGPQHMARRRVGSFVQVKCLISSNGPLR